MITFALIILSFVLFLLFILRKGKNPNAPPYIRGLPLLGYVPFLGREPYLTLYKLTEKYGPVISMHFGTTPTVVLGNFDALQEAYLKKGNNFNNRPPNLPFKVYDYEKAFIYLSGEKWKTSRNFTMNILKSFGFEKKTMESRFQYEVECFIEEVKRHIGIPFTIDKVLANNIGKSTLSFITGESQNIPDSWIEELTSTAEKLVQSYSFDFGTLFPWMTKIPLLKKLTVKQETRKLKDKYWTLWNEEIDKQRNNFSDGFSEPKSFIQHWFNEQNKRQSNNDPHKDLFCDFSLTNNIDILLQASVDTTSVTILWAYFYLILYPEMQKRIHDEIDQFIGENMEANFKHMENMKFTKAFIMEVHRKGSVVPLGAFHRNKDDDVIQGYHICKSSLIVGNLWGVHHDPKYFPEPFKFNPERFLDEDGKQKPCNQIVPFSIGGRVCPGKSIAELLVFLYIVTTLKHFKLSAPPGSNYTDKSYLDKAFIRRPNAFQIIFTGH